jgi:hypothetical protein
MRDEKHRVRVSQSRGSWLAHGAHPRASMVGAYAMSAARLLEICGAGGLSLGGSFDSDSETLVSSPRTPLARFSDRSSWIAGSTIWRSVCGPT